MPKALAPETIDTHLRIPREDYEALAERAEHEGRTVSNLIRYLLAQALASNEGESS